MDLKKALKKGFIFVNFLNGKGWKKMKIKATVTGVTGTDIDKNNRNSQWSKSGGFTLTKTK